MLFRRLSILLLLHLAVSAGLTSYAIESAITKKHTTAPATNPDGSIKRAPTAKPFKTKSKGHKSRYSFKSSSKSYSKTASTKSVAINPTPSATASAIHPSTHTTSAAILRPATLTSIGSREAITARVMRSLASTKFGIENPRALQPFFDQLHQLEADPASQLVRVIQFGDSHTAGDSFTGALRTLFQQKFGDGGAGFQFAGYPFAGYHIHGTKR